MKTIHYLNADVLNLIEKHEERRKEIYKDSAGWGTIGVGHKLTPSELSSGKLNIAGAQVTYRHGLTDAQIDTLFLQDIGKTIAAVNESVVVDINQNQFNALVSFTYNVGVEAFKKSTLLKKLNAGDIQAPTSELPRWKWAGGKVLRGLVSRRENEIQVYNTPVMSV